MQALGLALGLALVGSGTSTDQDVSVLFRATPQRSVA